jgi:hypothetical protein
MLMSAVFGRLFQKTGCAGGGLKQLLFYNKPLVLAIGLVLFGNDAKMGNQAAMVVWYRRLPLRWCWR